jgi:genome maintenance exonuclease 1
MLLNKKFAYRDLERVTRPDGFRHYIDPDNGQALTSVTTILSETADKTALLEWRAWVGDKKADQIRNDACALGNLMHLHLENFVLGEERPRGTMPIRVMAKNMSDQIINKGLCHVDEVWGCEVILHTPGGWAGTTDLVGLWKGKPAILDYKTSKKMKKYSSTIVQDYCAQGSAYRISHNSLHGTDIQTVVIFMVDRDLNFETFVVEGNELQKATTRWYQRVAAYQNKISQ